MDEMNKKSIGEDTLNDIMAEIQAASGEVKPAAQPAAQPTGTVEVDEKFRDFFTTTVAVIPEDARVGGKSAEQEEDDAPAKKGFFGWLGGLFRRDKDDSFDEDEVMIPGKTTPAEPEPELETGELVVEALPEPSDETVQIDLNMMQDAASGATGEIRLADLEALEEERAARAEAEEKPAKKSGGIRFITGEAPKLAKKEKKQPAVQPQPAAEQPAEEPAEQPAPVVEKPAGKLTFEDIDIAAILAAGAPGAAQPVAKAEPAAPVVEQEPAPAAKAPAEEPAAPVEQAAEQPVEESTREIVDLSALGTPEDLMVDEPTGEILLFPLEEDTAEVVLPAFEAEEEATREIPAPVPAVEYSTREPQLVAVEEPTGEVSLIAEEEEPAAQPVEEAASSEEEAAAESTQELEELKEKTRTAAIKLFGDEEPEAEAEVEEELPAEEQDELPPLEEPEPAAAEYEDPSDAELVAASLHSGLTKYTVRAIVTAAIALILVLLGLSAQGILLLATPLDPEIAPQAFLGVNLGLLLVAAGLSLNVLKEGLAGLTGKASPHTLPAVTAVAAVLQLAVCLLMPAGYDPAKTTVFAPLAVLLLCADHLGSRLMQQVVEDNFAMVSAGVDHAAAYCLKDKNLAATLTAGMDEKEPTVLLSRPATLVKDFMAQSFSARYSDAKAQKMARILLIGAGLGAVLALVRGGGLVGAFTALVGVLCLGAPLSATLVSAVPSLLMQRAAAKVGAVVPGWYNVEQLSRVDAVQVDAKELFGMGCAELEGIKTFRKERIDLAILYATSVLIEGCNTLSDLFRAMIEDKTEMLYEVKDLERKPGLGVVAWCDNCRVVMGNRAMMAQEDIALPPMDYENRYTKDGTYQALYLAVSGQLYALFVLKYRGRRKVKEGLTVLEREGVRLLVTCQDPTLIAERIEAAYKLKPGYVKVLSADEQAALEPATRYMPASEGCMVHLGSFASLMGGLKAAGGASEGERGACLIQTVSVLFSVVLGLLLAFTGGVGGMSLLAMVLYQLAWSGLSVGLALTKKY